MRCCQSFWHVSCFLSGLSRVSVFFDLSSFYLASSLVLSLPSRSQPLFAVVATKANPVPCPRCLLFCAQQHERHLPCAPHDPSIYPKFRAAPRATCEREWVAAVAATDTCGATQGVFQCCCTLVGPLFVKICTFRIFFCKQQKIEYAWKFLWKFKWLSITPLAFSVSMTSPIIWCAHCVLSREEEEREKREKRNETNDQKNDETHSYVSL